FDLCGALIPAFHCIPDIFSCFANQNRLQDRAINGLKEVVLDFRILKLTFICNTQLLSGGVGRSHRHTCLN
ncbi:hypothetical protein A2U01_0075649, partial [Trifolium medium]|nr:hypothetical protein [Trifolium medium]